MTQTFSSLTSSAGFLLARSRRALAGERGEGPVSAAILAPAVLILTWALLQVGFWWYGDTLAKNAAQVAVDSARSLNASGGDGQAAANTFLDRSGHGLLHGVSISVDRGDLVTARVSADTPRLTPFIPLPRIEVVAAGPAERVTQP